MLRGEDTRYNVIEEMCISNVDLILDYRPTGGIMNQVYLSGPLGYKSLRLAKTVDCFYKGTSGKLSFQMYAGLGPASNTSRYFTRVEQNHYEICYKERVYQKMVGIGFFLFYLPKYHSLNLSFGKSKDDIILLPANVSVVVKPRKRKYLYKFVSNDKEVLGNFCKLLQAQFYPDPYRLKGIRFLKEQLLVKLGKKKK